ncbi:DNA gyrase inhibitor YacG [Sphingomonas sp. BIUV-7]|uniref:DNA gyrase inhibitor YacG n=1 Tax=Sphingomonas natans TaxID=3063330 RepID=A0ABT8YBZ7_9SPHN|nr:DNA gyrase inhibitor YacG [Sphingomonas sp. BIUV-7]MDO6415865.1 DNA gyrase inhibitor YacG [Sphingomonas sp. BIUV-7]
MPNRRASAPCPVCGKAAAEGHLPFCSQGCRDRDLLQWLSDGHRIPGRSVDEGEDGSDDGLDS